MKKNPFKHISTLTCALCLALTIAVSAIPSTALYVDNEYIENENSNEYELPPIDVRIDDKPQDDC